MRYLTHLECSYCRQQHDAGQLIRLCPDCGYHLLARYDLLKAAVELDRDEINARPAGLWHFRVVLPVQDPDFMITLEEGGKPTLKLEKLGRRFGSSVIYLKDEGQNPTGSFKALGLAVAITRR